jgi:hypothetical protein
LSSNVVIFAHSPLFSPHIDCRQVSSETATRCRRMSSDVVGNGAIRRPLSAGPPRASASGIRRDQPVQTVNIPEGRRAAQAVP